MTVAILLAILWSNAFLLGILILLYRAGRDLHEVTRQLRVDSYITASKTSEIASAVKNGNGDKHPALVVEDTNAST